MHLLQGHNLDCMVDSCQMAGFVRTGAYGINVNGIIRDHVNNRVLGWVLSIYRGPVCEEARSPDRVGCVGSDTGTKCLSGAGVCVGRRSSEVEHGVQDGSKISSTYRGPVCVLGTRSCRGPVCHQWKRKNSASNGRLV